MHVQCLTVSSTAAHSRSHDDKLSISSKIPNTALLAGGFMARVGLDVEFQRRDQWKDKGQEQLQCQHQGGCHGGSSSMRREDGIAGLHIELDAALACGILVATSQGLKD
jgi:hypothetical protein